MLTIITKIDNTIKKFNMLKKGDTVVLGVSGGADSMLMLSYFIEKRKQLNLKLIVANVEHGIRGQDSVDDSKFVEEFCNKSNVEYKLLKINAVQEARAAGEGVEEYSRKRRYEFFNSFNADKIATAHNLSDNAETLLFRLSRGAGINGVCSIPAVRDNIIRPLIECSSQEIRQYCNDYNIPYVIDKTNEDNAYSRNYIRNIIIPAFKALNPMAEEAMSRFITSACEANELINSLAETCFNNAVSKEGLKISELKNQHKLIAKSVIQKYFKQYDIVLDEKHLNGVYALLFKQSKYQIRKNAFAVSNKRLLRLAFFDSRLSFSEKNYIIKNITVEEFQSNINENKKMFAFYCDCDKINDKLFIRKRQEGDVIKPEGRNVTKTLKKLFNEYHIPVEKRELVPVICDSSGIIGVMGYCRSEKVKVDSSTKNVTVIYSEDNI